MSDEFQLQKYASFPCYAYWLVSKHSPWATVHILHRSTPSMMIPLSIYFISIGHFFWAKTRVKLPVSLGGRGTGTVVAGGISWRKFAKDGEMSYLGQHPTWAFPLPVHMACQLRICWRIHLHFHSSSIILAVIASPQKMKRE